MAEPGVVKGGPRIKTPQQIERQSARAYIMNYLDGRKSPDGENYARGSAIVRATNNARRRAGYESIGVRTRSLDTIFRNLSDGRYFTVQGDRIVAYRGKKLKRY